MDLQVLLAVQQQGRVELHPRQCAEVAHGAEGRDHTPARENLEVLLIRVGQLVRVCLGIAGAQPQVIEDDAVAVPGEAAAGHGGAHSVRVDRHGALLLSKCCAAILPCTAHPISGQAEPGRFR
ncbi:hypothetical protein EDM76_12960 [bacterium]|nr:MAG: hypothetical protein EDM76_12960 [bacterium]